MNVLKRVYSILCLCKEETAKNVYYAVQFLMQPKKRNCSGYLLY